MLHDVETLSVFAEKKEVRKIQFTGRSTYILSLPKKWIEEMNLQPGDPVTIVRQINNSLLILPNIVAKSSKTGEATVIVTSNESGNSLKRMIISIYLAGYNVIHVKSKAGRISPQHKDAIRQVVRRNLVGTEIVADSDYTTIQVLMSLPELSIGSALRRMFLIASTMHRDAINALKELNLDLADGVIKSDDEVDRFSLYIMRNLVIASQNERVLREVGLKNPSDCLSYRVAVKSVERIADHASSIAEKVKEIKEKPNAKLIQKITDMSNYSLSVFEDAVESLLRRDYALADKVAEKAISIRNLEQETLAILSRSHDNTAGNYKLILEDIRRVAEYSSDIGEAAMNQTIEEVITV
ncbi:MAG: phosphate uptake regulator PhoU [Nitrososphaerales archaeon]